MVVVLRLPAYLSEPEPEEPPDPPTWPIDQLTLELDLAQDRRSDPGPFRARQLRLHAAAGHLIATVLEALNGQRPLRQLLHTKLTEAVHRRLAAQLRRARPGHPHRLRTVHVCEPAAGVIEASGTITLGPRVRAVTARIETTPRGWLCTSFAIL
ncbi:Rv3235 family protein [Allokutzneria sp. A3M-2-11 16]|uniref:Rv3235 family protein n=1 Tax=Allokutzneria sp. A3M-2-11 16 TaxID=2962043 RepID=UPI0020B8B597|nr:Rv3235 family protein [Allokutzneria sp. A3M-2-11 16]MCP3800532.1 Rv3235 family protein [Allokutzneria sp. A3M-2-11 16]